MRSPFGTMGYGVPFGLGGVNVDGVSTAVPRRNRSKQLVLASKTAQLYLCSAKCLEQHRQVTPAVAPRPVAEALPVEVLMRVVAPALASHVHPVSAGFAP